MDHFDIISNCSPVSGGEHHPSFAQLASAPCSAPHLVSAWPGQWPFSNGRFGHFPMVISHDFPVVYQSIWVYQSIHFLVVFYPLSALSQNFTPKLFYTSLSYSFHSCTSRNVTRRIKQANSSPEAQESKSSCKSVPLANVSCRPIPLPLAAMTLLGVGTWCWLSSKRRGFGRWDSDGLWRLWKQGLLQDLQVAKLETKIPSGNLT